jgi:hypothetical protein
MLSRGTSFVGFKGEMSGGEVDIEKGDEEEMFGLGIGAIGSGEEGRRTVRA